MDEKPEGSSTRTSGVKLPERFSVIHGPDPGTWLVDVRRWTTHAREYVAKVTGRDPKYTWARRFCRVYKRDWSRSGANGVTTILVSGPGIYEFSDPTTGLRGAEARYWAELTDHGEWLPLKYEDLFERFPPIEEGSTMA